MTSTNCQVVAPTQLWISAETGYTAYFTGLGKEIQDEIIARESHQL